MPREPPDDYEYVNSSSREARENSRERLGVEHIKNRNRYYPGNACSTLKIIGIPRTYIWLVTKRPRPRQSASHTGTFLPVRREPRSRGAHSRRRRSELEVLSSLVGARSLVSEVSSLQRSGRSHASSGKAGRAAQIPIGSPISARAQMARARPPWAHAAPPLHRARAPCTLHDQTRSSRRELGQRVRGGPQTGRRSK